MPFLVPGRIILTLLSCLLLLLVDAAVSAEPAPTLKVGVYQNGPKIFINEEGQPDGFFVDLLQEISQRANFKVEYVEVSWKEGIRAMENGDLDFMPDVVLTANRRKRYYFNSITVLENWANLYIHEDQKPEHYTFQDITNMRIGYMEDDSNFDAFKAELGSDTTTLTFVAYKSYPEVMQAIHERQVNMGLVNHYFGRERHGNYDIQALDLIINPGTVHWASALAQRQSILQQIDEELCRLKEDKESVYYGLVSKWFDIDNRFKFPRWLSVLLTGLAFFFFVSLVTMSGLQLRLRNRKNELRTINQQLQNEIVKKTAIEDSLRKRNQELDATNRAMDQLVYRVSHNLRAPISSVLGLIEVIKIEIPQTAATYMQAMEKSMHQLDNIIRDILDYYRNNRSELNKDEVALAETIQSIYESMAYLNKDVNIPLQLNIQQEAKLITDQRRLSSVLHNLISNALKYYNPYATEHFLKIEGKVNATEVKLTIADNGIGVPPEQQEKIFTMFFRGSAQGSGAGLGLYIVRETLERLGGTIQLHSDLNKGTTFTIQLPNLA